MGKLVAAIGVAWGMALVVPLLLIAGLSRPESQMCVPGTTGNVAVPASAASAGLNDDQLAHAAAVIAEGRKQAVPDRGIVIALATALQESGLRVYANDGLGGDLASDQQGIGRSLRLPHEAVGTDHGSLGIFQQQWPWWGDMSELMDPARSAGLFYAALSRTPNWRALPVTVAAQAVQRSAYPSAYADDEPLARRLLTELGNGIVGTAVDCAALTAGGMVVYPLSQGSGYVDRRNFGGSGSHWSSRHTGTDLSVACGTRVVAAHGGTVHIRTDQSWAGPWLVQVQRAPGTLTTWYAHMRRVTVPDGATVRPGQQIGEVGDLGNATGCHLHFEVHPHGGSIYEDPVDPTTWLAKNAGRGRLTVEVAPLDPADADGFVLASFNTLGNSHTNGKGHSPGMASGVARTHGLVQLLKQHRVAVAGLQEFQDPQFKAFRRLVGSSYAAYYPGKDTDNAIVWRTSMFELVKARSIPITYFHGNTRRMPYVFLRQRETGQSLWVVNVHNPASVLGPAAKWRAISTAREVALVERLARTGRPVLVTGDMNEREHAFCRFTGSGTLKFPSGGSTGPRCRPPSYRGIDWIFGTRNLKFSDWSVDRGALVRRTTDHPLVVATVHLGNTQ